MKRENFGVQQLPLLNHLKPGSEIGASLSNIQGRRGLNANRTVKFALRRIGESQMFLGFLYFFLFFLCEKVIYALDPG